MGGRLTGPRARFVGALACVALVAGIVVTAAAALRFNDTPCIEQGGGGIRLCPGGTVDKNYSITIEGSGGCGPALPYQYKVLNGALPAGLSLSSSGVISGRPTGAGTADFWLEISDQDPPTAAWCRVAKAEHEFRIVISPGLAIQTNSLPPGASVGVPYSAPLSALLVTNTAVSPPQGTVPGSIQWSVASGTLPPGLAIANNAVSGTPTAEGTFTFQIKAVVGEASDMETLTLVVRAPPVIEALPPFAAHGVPTLGEVGLPFAAKLNATGGTGVYTWSLAVGSALPLGLALAADGTVAGTPREAGTFQSTIHLADNEGRTADYAAIFNIAARLAITTLTLRPAKVGHLYKTTFKTFGGHKPKKWKFKKRGKLPRAFRLDRTLGQLTGTPGKPGRYHFVLEVVDSLGVRDTQGFVLVVTA